MTIRLVRVSAAIIRAKSSFAVAAFAIVHLLRSTGPAAAIWAPSINRFVGGVVVDDGVHRLALWHLGFDRFEEADEFLVAVTLQAAVDDLAVRHIQRGE